MALPFTKKNETLGDNGGGNVFFVSFFSFLFWFLCASLSDLLSSRHHFLLSLRTLGICRLVLLAGGVSIMSKASVP